ncbi:dipeptidase PepE [Carboxylicivirga mesophila]|uniref:Dipeptidase PepE n=1 Tax=Carboxylicivirga mesophila TaxID=1166478 RepID=A0ABS5KGX5_9BACT|nr:dipeptidase PepE [Carboxylicivirga mesophila]MBS2213992.1 dipeptidase PepE [Carboxylicivirga mesophila]
MNLLLISNSTMAGEAYLDYPKHDIAGFLGKEKVKCLFIPYAGVTVSFDDYEAKVKSRFNEVGHDVVSIHHFDDPVKAVEEADAIVVGGGSTWQLLRMVHDNQLTEPIRKKVLGGTKYIGWSAGSNLACPTIKTTNDMPIIDPLGFDALNLIPFQINPHYLDANPEGHGGETREERIMEFLEVNQQTTVAGLREGCMFVVKNGEIGYKGALSLRVFQYGKAPYEVEPSADFSFLMSL